jgi:hypothetical protein
VGHPQLAHYPIVDPRGLITPYFDGWSIDFWLWSGEGDLLVPAMTEDVDQRLDLKTHGLSVVTCVQTAGRRLATTVWVDRDATGFKTHIRARGQSDRSGWLVMALRPYNPEGIQFIDAIGSEEDRRRLRVNQGVGVYMDPPPQKILFSNYAAGDVAHALDAPESATAVVCDIGMATAAALFPLQTGNTTEVKFSLPLIESLPKEATERVTKTEATPRAWANLLSGTARLQVPDHHLQFLYDAAVKTLLLLTAEEACPGPYTYKRFWFRDACLMIHALLNIGLIERAERLVRSFPDRQTMTGYFQSQEGEWDSNGQVLWIAGRLHDIAGISYDDRFLTALFRGADWITKKRLKKAVDKPHQGMLPAGFSAEHLGPNDYYYWDNFWSLAGLQAAARLAGDAQDARRESDLQRQARTYRLALLHSIANIPAKRRRGAIPASPYRRLDAGAVGSLAADYPLKLFKPNDPMIMKTVAYLMHSCFHSGAFFQDMIHAGINIYLTLAIAQTLLRAGDPGYRQLIHAVADLATPTGQWPEAIHPFTKGGCMGDGQHAWAAAEWLMMMRNLFVREEEGAFLIGSGIFPEWIDAGQPVAYGPTPVPGGHLGIRLQKTGRQLEVHLDGKLDAIGKPLVASVPGYARRAIVDGVVRLEAVGPAPSMPVFSHVD